MLLSDLPTSVLCEVLRHFEAPELSALACTCRLYHRIVTQDLGEEYWRNLYRAQYPQYEALARGPPRDWKTLYKDSFVKTKRIRQRALQRKVNELQNDIHDVNREIRTLNEEANDLINQERSHTSLYQEMDRGRSAEVALKTWSPVSVSVWHKQVVEQTPLDRTTRMEDLESKLSSFSMMTAQIAATSGGCAMMGAVAPGNALSSARSWKRRRQLSLRKSGYEVMRRKRSSGSEDDDSATFSERFLSVSQRILESIRSFKI